MDAREKILKVLKWKKEEGVLQSELPKLTSLSKSTVSEIISALEAEKIVVKSEITKKSYRIWLLEYYPNPLKNTIRVGMLKASEYPAVIIAAKKLNGIIRVFNDPLELTKALCIGSIDVAASPLVTQALFGCLMKNILIFRIVAFNGSGVVMNKEHCKRIGTTELSTMELNLKRVNKDWKFVYFKDPEIMISSFKDGEIDGIAIWEPYLTMLSKEYDVLMFNEIVGDFPCCSLATNNKFLAKNKNLFDRFLQEFDKFDEESKVAEELSKYIGFDKKLIEKSFSSFLFNKKASNREILEFLEKEVFLRRENLKPMLKLDYLNFKS